MRLILFSLSLFLFSSYTLAEGILSSEFYYFVNQRDLVKLIAQGQGGTAEGRLQDISFAQPYKSEVKGVSYRAKYHYELVADATQGNRYFVLAKIDTFEVFVEHIETDATVSNQLGGLTLDIRIQGECRGIKIQSQKNAGSFEGALRFVNQKTSLAAQLEISDFQLGAWQFSAASCQGPAEYEKGVRDAVVKYLQDKKLFISLIEEKLQSVVDEQLTSATEQVMKDFEVVYEKSGRLRFQPENIAIVPETGGVKIQGLVSSQPDPEDITSLYVPFLLDKEQMDRRRSTGVMISKRFVKYLAEQLHEKEIFQQRFYSQEISGFRDLQKSRFSQFFAFPDLMNFSKKSNFALDSMLTESPKIVSYKKQGESLLVRTKARAYVNMLAPKRSDYVSYMHFYSNIDSYVRLSLVGGNLHANVTDSEMDLSQFWDKEYVRQYSPNEFFNKSAFRKRLRKALNQSQFVYELPTFELVEGQKLMPRKLRQGKDFIYLNYGIQ